jgi:hypothetical protein
MYKHQRTLDDKPYITHYKHINTSNATHYKIFARHQHFKNQLSIIKFIFSNMNYNFRTALQYSMCINPIRDY